MTHISNNQTLNAGSSVTLNCSADGNPPPVIRWTRVSDNSAVVFPLTNIGLQHEGTYRCTANNSVGSPVTRDVSIVVKGTSFTFMRDLRYNASILFTRVKFTYVNR